MLFFVKQTSQNSYFMMISVILTTQLLFLQIPNAYECPMSYGRVLVSRQTCVISIVVLPWWCRNVCQTVQVLSRRIDWPSRRVDRA